MLNFPSISPEHLRKLRSQLLTPQSDPTWHGTVTQLLQALIDADLGNHRTFTLEKLREREHEVHDKPFYADQKVDGGGEIEHEDEETSPLHEG